MNDLNIIVNGVRAGSKATGCALCGATWGDHHEEMFGEDLFFCCDICAAEFRNMIEKALQNTPINKIDELRINGNYRDGRHVVINNEKNSLSFYVKFGPGAVIEEFRMEK
nr:TA0938 family protein [Thermoplasma sp.]